MRKMTLNWAVSIIVVAAACPCFARLGQFSGEWKNPDPSTRGITALDIQVTGNNVTVQAWGKCHPQDCDWGRVNAHAYAPSVSSSLTDTARAITAVFRTNFSQTLVVIDAIGENRLRAEAFTHFTDNSGRSNYVQAYTFVRAAQGAGLLPAPTLVSPTNGTEFSHYPRRTTLAWRPVPGAASYTVQIDCLHCCQTNMWCNDVGRTWKEAAGLNTTSYTFDFVGAQPGRWRVWAVDTPGRPGLKSQWWDFRYTR